MSGFSIQVFLNMKAGRLKLRGIIQELTDSVGARGGPTKTWAEYAKRWMQVIPVQGAERFVASRELGLGRGVFRCRYVAGLTTKMRVLLPKEATTLDGAINDTVTSITVASADDFPNSGNYRVRIGSEVLEVTAGQGTTSWTVTRGVDGSTAASHGDGAGVRRLGIFDIESVINVAEAKKEMELSVKEEAA